MCVSVFWMKQTDWQADLLYEIVSAAMADKDGGFTQKYIMQIPASCDLRILPVLQEYEQRSQILYCRIIH